MLSNKQVLEKCNPAYGVSSCYTGMRVTTALSGVARRGGTRPLQTFGKNVVLLGCK